MDAHDFFEQMAGNDRPFALSSDQTATVARLHDRLAPWSGKRILEPGCGSGVLTAYLAEWIGPDGCIHAFDRSPAMIEHARSHLTAAKHVHLFQADAETLPVEDGRWDYIICFRFYPHLQNPDVFLQNCRRALAPGGALVIANLEGSRELNAIHAKHHGVSHDHMPSAEELKQKLEHAGWCVKEAVDNPDDFYLIAAPAV